MKSNKIFVNLIFIIFILSIIAFSPNINAGNSQKFYEGDFFVGLAELYYGENNIEGNIEIIEDSNLFSEKVNTGRISLYLKGKIRGKYLITAWLDTQEQDLDKLFKNIGKRKENTPFEKIDPEKYYPIYGDQSSIDSGVKTAGKLYIKLKSEEFNALWGNFKINYNKNNLIALKKNIYGANLSYNSRLRFNTFWYQSLSIQTRDELKITGGLLYYLSKDDIIAGSENVKLVLRDSVTDKVVESNELQAGYDYDINYLQGRIILKKKINNIFEEELIEDESIDNKYYLIVDYQYNYEMDNNSNENYGLETSYKINENITLTGNYLNERNENGEGYKLNGLDLNIQLTNNSNIQLSWAESKNKISEKQYSNDGGISYEQISLDSSPYAKAYNLEYKNNSFINPKHAIELYYSYKDKGFNSGSKFIENRKENYGVEIKSNLDQYKNTYSYRKDNTGEKQTQVYNITSEIKYSDKVDIDLGLINKEKDTKENKKENSLVGALGIEYRPKDNKKIYASQQLTLSKNEQAESKNITTVGGELKKERWNYKVEAKAGDKQNIVLGAGYSLNKNTELYSNIESNYGKESSYTTTVGTSTKLNQNTNIMAEHRFISSDNEEKTSNVIGLDFIAAQNLQLSLDYTKSEVKEKNQESFYREIIGLGTNFNKKNIKNSNRIEYRTDNNNENFKQIFLKSDTKWQYNKELSFISEIEYSKEEKKEYDEFIKGTFGVAYRPILNDRINYLAKYSYLEEENYLANHQADEDEYDYLAEKAQVFSLDLIYDLNVDWQLKEKIAYKNGEIKLNSKDDNWITSETYLWVNRVDYSIKKDINLFVEYRLLENKLAKDRRSGFVIGGYKRFDNNLKLGLGYNFTDFNDDLTNLNYNAKGWFINIIKAW